jgi:hypothetical protein
MYVTQFILGLDPRKASSTNSLAMSINNKPTYRVHSNNGALLPKKRCMLY